ncbi:MAG: RelA/SpoT domain-containing protein [Spirochaetales bacterium]|nr:RelA/SpoT domain-containing protein [Spirochaetales bacterium]
MSTIGEFLTYYKGNYSFYKELAQELAEQCESLLKIRGIKAIVSSRAKKPDSLNAKIIKLDRKERFRRIEDITKKLTDLSGVRIAVYFPEDRKKIESILDENFNIIRKRNFPAGKHSPGFEKRFSGYWATHFLVKFKDLEKSHPFYNKIVEIQVASVLMHAWAEIEHDLVYKPLNGKISKEELSIIDELNGLMLCGEIALERLKKAMDQRIQRTKTFNDDSELTSYIFERVGADNIGDTKILSILLSELPGLEISDIQNYLDNTLFDKTKSIAAQLTDALLFDYLILKNNEIEKVFEVFKYTGIYEIGSRQAYKFLRLWFGLELTFFNINKTLEDYDNKYMGIFQTTEKLKEKISLKPSRAERILEASHIRDSLLEGRNLYSEELLRKKNEELYSDIKKLLREIEDEELKDKIYRSVRTNFYNEEPFTI